MEEKSEDNRENEEETVVREKEKIEGESDGRSLVETIDGLTQIPGVEGESASACTSKTDDDGSSPFKSPKLAFKLPTAMTKSSPKSVEIKEKPMKGCEIAKDNAGEEKKREGSGGDGGEVEKSGAAAKRKQNIAAALTPAQKKKYENIPIPYKEPSWSGIPETAYHLEVLKMGKIVDTIQLDSKPFIVFGRLPTCDVPMEHPSLSRFHAILQYRASDESPEAPEDKKKGFYLLDLGSTHGTFLNKNQVEANTFIRLKTGHMFKFGGSSRYFIMQGGTKEDEETESELSLTQLKQMRKVREEHLRSKVAEEEERERQAKERDAKGATWGFADDAEADDDDDDDEVIDMAKNPYSKTTGKAEHEDKYSDDPRKCLQNWFEREGEDLEYEFVEEGTGKKKTFFCRITLPVDAEEPVIAEGEGTNKKQAKIIAALEACKTLDARGLLFQSHQESTAERRRKKLEENDFYDSDEDEFLDRTGEIEAKRRRRMAQLGVKAEEEKALTYAELVAKLDAVRDETTEIERKLEKAKRDAEAAGGGGEDSLDAFMSAIKSGRSLDTKTRIKLKMRLQELKKEQLKFQRLADIARPANLPPLQKPTAGVRNCGAGIWVGKMGRGRGKGPMMTPVRVTLPAKKEENGDDGGEEEEDEDEEEESKDSASTSDKNCTAVNDTRKSNAGSVRRDAVPSADAVMETDASSSAATNESRPAPVPVKVKLTIGESSLAKRKSAASSVSSAVKTSGMDTGPRLPEVSSSSKDRGQDFSVSAILSSRVTEAYNEEKMKDPKFSMWVPPVDQAGDGKTKLNEKFGY